MKTFFAKPAYIIKPIKARYYTLPLNYLLLFILQMECLLGNVSKNEILFILYNTKLYKFRQAFLMHLQAESDGDNNNY